MDSSAFIGGTVAGLCYFIAGISLIRLSWRSQRPSDVLIGISFFLWGVSYACWQIPIATPSQPLTQPLFFAGRIFTHTGTIFFAAFTWIEFRNQSPWAKWLVFAIATTLIAGVAGSVVIGDWEGIRPISNTWWWAEWIAGLVAMTWVGVEGFIAYPKARQRMRLDLCEPLECNRLLLWGITGITSAAYSCALLFYTTSFEADGFWSAPLDRISGTLEVATIALVCLIYFPPRFYKRWIAGAAPAAEPEEA
jgi:hypothetical protein